MDVGNGTDSGNKVDDQEKATAEKKILKHVRPLAKKNEDGKDYIKPDYNITHRGHFDIQVSCITFINLKFGQCGIARDYLTSHEIVCGYNSALSSTLYIKRTLLISVIVDLQHWTQTAR